MPGDLILRKVVGTSPNCEGLYRVTAMVGAGAYYLEDLEERPLP